MIFFVHAASAKKFITATKYRYPPNWDHSPVITTCPDNNCSDTLSTPKLLHPLLATAKVYISGLKYLTAFGMKNEPINIISARKLFQPNSLCH